MLRRNDLPLKNEKLGIFQMPWGKKRLLICLGKKGLWACLLCPQKDGCSACLVCLQRKGHWEICRGRDCKDNFKTGIT